MNCHSWILAALISLGFIGVTFASPNIENGKSIDDSKCYSCHSNKSGLGNGDMIYTRTDGKVKNLARLRSMVSVCNTELRLDLFPEDEEDVVAYLNRQFYKFIR